MIVAVVVLIASELTVFTEGRIVKIIAVAVDVIFREILVIANLIIVTELASLRPGFCLNFKEFDIGGIICFANQKVAELMKKKELWLLGFFGGVIEVVGRRELKTFAGAYL